MRPTPAEIELVAIALFESAARASSKGSLLDRSWWRDFEDRRYYRLLAIEMIREADRDTMGSLGR